MPAVTVVDSQTTGKKIAQDGRDHRGDPLGPVPSAEVITGKQIVLEGLYPRGQFWQPSRPDGTEGARGPRCGSFDPVVHRDTRAPRDPRGRRKDHPFPSGFRSLL